MNETVKTRDDVLHVHQKHVEGKDVLIHMDDQDRFLMTGRLMIASCKLGISIQTWFDELVAAREEVQRWCSSRSDEIVAAYLAPRGHKLVIYLIQRSSTFNFDLADAATELNINLIRNFNLGTVEICQLPEREIGQFIDPQEGALVYGEPCGTHQPVET